MTIYKFPLSERKGHDSSKEKEPKSDPEVIDIEDFQYEEIITEEGSAYFKPGQFRQTNLPVFLRILALGASAVLFAIGAILLFLAIFMTLLRVITLNQFPDIIFQTQKLWSAAGRSLAIGLGLFISTFSPALGMGFIGLYVALNGEQLESYIMNRFAPKNGP